MSRASFLLFCVAFVMLVVATVPKLRSRVQGCRVKDEELQALHLTGSVYREVTDNNGKTALKPITGAVVEVGGFRASTDATGRYELQFCSSTSDAIPIVLDDGGKEEFQRVTFPMSSSAAQKDFVLR
ncbi:MAG: hypothetical protein WA857_03470 [Candidatus Acidiferrum sp.]